MGPRAESVASASRSAAVTNGEQRSIHVQHENTHAELVPLLRYR